MRLAGLFVDHAVLQRGVPIPVWGWCAPRERVRVTLGDAAGEMLAGADGRFLVRLPPQPAGGPFALEVTAGGERVTVRDVMVGEVWLCSGQSNMQFPLAQCETPAALESVAWPLLRMFTVPRCADSGRLNDVTGEWQCATPANVVSFSAVGYHFGLKLHRELGVAVGLLNASWGGTRVEAWTSREALMGNADTRLDVEHMEATCNDPAFWRDAPTGLALPADPGIGAHAAAWARPDCDDSGWPTMTLPSCWQASGHHFSGIFWFRFTVDVPAAWAGRDLQLGIGAVDKHDITFFNGEQVGAMGSGYDESKYSIPRLYPVPGRLVRPGRNVVAVRAYSFLYEGGLIGPASRMMLRLPGDSASAISLAGDWRFAIECNFGLVVPPAARPGPGNPNCAGALFDNLIAPLLPYALRGAIWYQGESNTNTTAGRHGRMLADMIRDWRRAWGQGDFAFLTVQLANHTVAAPFQPESLWALVREGQAQTLALTATGLAVAIDIGEANDIHPKNKRDVGQRLARWALVETYGRPGVPSGPLYAGMSLERGAVRLRFHHTGGGLVARDGALRTFVIAGSDGKFVPAEATLEGATVVVRSAAVPRPAAVRYAWANNPEGCNLYNAEGLPAAPFRTDVW